jgi:Tfp pilus assembly protein PilF
MRAAGGILGGTELFEKAFAEIDKAIKHTPTIIELYIHKAKLYQRCGEP